MTEQLIIDGSKIAASDAGTFDVYDPSTGDVPAVAKATKADVDRAVNAAHSALESKAWGGAPPAERGRVMMRIAHALRDRADDLATLESRDNGKPLKQARTDVQVAARYFEFFAGIADKIMGNTIPLGPGFIDFTIREPSASRRRSFRGTIDRDRRAAASRRDRGGLHRRAETSRRRR
jgi:acyl-CoA reductase-like NAD-dependent aldehyde dehydrogenase